MRRRLEEEAAATAAVGAVGAVGVGVGKDNGWRRRKSRLMAEETDDDVTCLIGPWILVNECDRASV